jgi:hypothetical protein
VAGTVASWSLGTCESTSTTLTLFLGSLQRYERASHNEKVEVSRSAISEMVTRGCRFLQRVNNKGSTEIEFEILSPDSSVIERKVIRALRQEVLRNLDEMNPADRSQINTDVGSSDEGEDSYTFVDEPQNAVE